MLDKKAEFKKFSSAGEKAVHEKIAQGIYNPERAKLAYEWLRQMDVDRINKIASRAEDAAIRAETIASKQLRLSKSAKTAAWIAAIAAITAAIITAIGMIISAC
jgi:hypothetical protein